ncbi:MAG: lysophospholipid acyltransferase family protein [Acidithiobacillus caldus]|nr:lysophospholipid acyltransferase family protein [Acidithiobacillus caldus]
MAYARWYQAATWEPSTVPDTGAVILACNHLSVLDPLLLIASNRRVVSFLVAREYYESRWLRPFLDLIHCIPVKRDGRDLRALRAAAQVLAAQRVLGIFPEGGIARSDVRRGLGWLVRESGAAVVPAKVMGVHQYPSDWRTWATRQRPRLRYGVPLHFLERAEPSEILGATMSAIATLA